MGITELAAERLPARLGRVQVIFMLSVRKVSPTVHRVTPWICLALPWGHGGLTVIKLVRLRGRRHAELWDPWSDPLVTAVVED